MPKKRTHKKIQAYSTSQGGKKTKIVAHVDREWAVVPYRFWLGSQAIKPEKPVWNLCTWNPQTKEIMGAVLYAHEDFDELITFSSLLNELWKPSVFEEMKKQLGNDSPYVQEAAKLLLELLFPFKMKDHI